MHHFDKKWTLFLDRDGVINEREPNGYITTWDDFDFIPGSIKAIEKLSQVFGYIIVITNQAGIGKGIFSEQQLHFIHRQMVKTIDLLDGRIDSVYYAPDRPDKPSHMRKPNTGMAEKAKKDFPSINFKKSVIVGDSVSDMEFGHRLGMVKVFIEGKGEDPSVLEPHYRHKSLAEFAKSIAHY